MRYRYRSLSSILIIILGLLFLRLPTSFGEPAISSSKIDAYLVSGMSKTLVAFYPFNGNVNDQSGNGNNGASSGGVSYPSGRIGQAASFDGTTGYISVPDSSSLRLNQFTLAAWINPTSIGGSGRIVEKGASNSYYLYTQQQCGTASRIQ